MKPSQACVDLVKHFESCRLEAYEDASPSKIPTIGYGHTGGVKLGDVIDQARADELLEHDLAAFAKAVDQAVKVPLTQNRFDALVSFAFNCRGWRDSSLIRYVNQRDWEAAESEFPKWIHSGGRELRGLVVRRLAERGLFSASYSAHTELAA